MNKYDILDLAAVIADEQRQAEIEAIHRLNAQTFNDMMALLAPNVKDTAASALRFVGAIAAGIRSGPFRTRPPRRMSRRAHSRKTKR